MDQFIDDKFDAMESDIEKVIAKPNMYISYTGRQGSLHLAKETINNMIDECTNINSPGRHIDIYYDQAENTLYVSDNGRGMPFDTIKKACTQLQAGSKMTRSNGGQSSAGENGVGLTATNALSERFEIISYRYGEKASIKFEKGQLIQDVTVEKIKDKKRHGTTTIFKPNPYYMNKEREDCQIPVEELMEWIRKITYMVPPEIKIRFQATLVGKNSSIDKTYQNQNGMYDYIKTMEGKRAFDPVHLVNIMKKDEVYREELYHRTVGIEVAFTYNLLTTTDAEPRCASFCNFIENVDGGTHLDTVRNTLSRYLIKETKNALTEREAKTIDIIRNDVMTGLDLAVYLSTDINPEFSGQTKEKVTSDAIIEPIREMLNESLSAYFLDNPKVLKKCTDMIKTSAKVRVAANKAKQTTIKANVSVLDEHRIPHFEPARAKGKNAYRELILMEGESAAGSVNDVRFKEFQATYGLRGYIPNAFSSALAKISSNEQLRAIATIMRAGLGKQFNLDNAHYSKVIILTDADSDGAYIASLISGFMLKYMRPFVEAGRLYKAQAPLYEIEDKERPFIRNKKEYIHIFEKRIQKHMNLASPENGVILSEQALEGFLLTNRNYLDVLHQISNYYATHQDIIEFVAMYGLQGDFADKLATRFTELEYDHVSGLISGIYEGRYQNILINKQFNRRLEAYRRLLMKGNMGQYEYQVQQIVGKDSFNDLGIMTIGQFMRACEKYRPDIKHRFKGLGEIESEDLRDTTLDPNNRTLIQLTVDDIEKEMETFEILQGDSKLAKEQRKKLVAAFDIDLDDLDN